MPARYELSRICKHIEIKWYRHGPGARCHESFPARAFRVLCVPIKNVCAKLVNISIGIARKHVSIIALSCVDRLSAAVPPKYTAYASTKKAHPALLHGACHAGFTVSH